MRRLSTPEWLEFQRAVGPEMLGVLFQNLPPWGGVVTWAGMDIFLNWDERGELQLTDISDNPEIREAILNYGYPTPGAQYTLTHLPEEVAYRIAEIVRTLLDALPQIPALALDWAPLLAILTGVVILREAK